MVYTVKVEPHPDDEKRYAKDETYKTEQIGTAKRLNVITGIGIGVAVLTLISLIVYACITYKQLRAMREANSLTYYSLTALQRAFVSPNIQELTTQNSDQQPMAAIIVNWVNSGTTPTKMFRTHVSSIDNTNSPLPDNFTYPDLWQSGAPHVNTDAVVGPKGGASVIGDSLPLTVLTEAFHHKRRIYIWGWATYYDVFKDTPMHITKFCSEMIVLGMNYAGGQTTINSKFDNCPHNNCYDQECK